MHRNAVFSTLLKDRALSDADWRKILAVRQNMIRWVYEGLELPKLGEVNTKLGKDSISFRLYVEEVLIAGVADIVVLDHRGFFRATRLRDATSDERLICAVGLDPSGHWEAIDLEVTNKTSGRLSIVTVDSPQELVERYRVTYRSLFNLQTEIAKLALKQERAYLAKIEALHGRIKAEAELVEHLRLMEEGEV